MQVAVLDVNETLFGLEPVGAALGEVGLDPDELDLWFARVLRDGFAVASMGGLAAFPDLADHHLRLLGHEREVAIGDADVDRVVDAFDEVEAKPDVADGLRRLADAGVRLAPFTNGSAPIVDRFLDRAGLAELCDPARDVTSADVWKPAAGAYRWVCDDLGVDPGDAAMVAVHPWDVAGAMRAGMVGAWLDRDAAPWPAFLPDPDHHATDLTALAASLLAA